MPLKAWLAPVKTYHATLQSQALLTLILARQRRTEVARAIGNYCTHDPSYIYLANTSIITGADQEKKYKTLTTRLPMPGVDRTVAPRV